MSSKVVKSPRAISTDRFITKFPQPFHPDATPYQKSNFHVRVKDFASSNGTSIASLKMCKAVMLGDVAVGKTSLVNRFCHNVFDRDYKATIGVDFEVEKFSILSRPFTLQIWDTAGQERFKCIAASYYRGANIVIVVFNLSDISSLENAKNWALDALDVANGALLFLVGAKKDLLSPGSYKEMEQSAIKLANELGAEYWATSSLTGENVQDFFFRCVAMTYDKLVLKELDTSNNSQHKIGSSLVTLNHGEVSGEYFEKSTKIKCCK